MLDKELSQHCLFDRKVSRFFCGGLCWVEYSSCVTITIFLENLSLRPVLPRLIRQ